MWFEPALQTFSSGFQCDRYMFVLHCNSRSFVWWWVHFPIQVAVQEKARTSVSCAQFDGYSSVHDAARVCDGEAAHANFGLI